LDGQSTGQPRLTANFRRNLGNMGKFVLIAGALVAVLVVGGATFLMVWDIPAPDARVERVIPDARLPK
jgi:hypothetical protein